MIVNKMEVTDEAYPDYDFEPVFFLGKAMYVPHYDSKHQWVTYGGGSKTTVELITVGAKPDIKHLWKRYWTEKEIFKGRSRHCSPTELKNMLLNQHIAKDKKK
jgi:hypothetical protein